MGFFDRFTGKKTAPAPTPAPAPNPAAAPAPGPASASAPVSAGGVKARLLAAREHIAARDLPAALAIYEEVLASAGDRADVLVAISGDLGSHGHVAEIVELVAPRYDADRHGPATGLNLLQAYLALRNADAAQHVLDILFALNRPELEERLFGFSNAIAELLVSPAAGAPAAGAPGDAAKIGLITISKPIWFYGLEPLQDQLFPPKTGRLRRLAFAQLALPGHGEKSVAGANAGPEDELGRLSRALPLWFAETFYYSPLYAPVAAVALITPPEGGNRYVNFGAEWTTENLRQLVETHEGGLDYIVSGALRSSAGDYELVLRVWEVKGFRERKAFQARWTPATMDAALAQLHGQVRAYMEWSPAPTSFAYAAPAQPPAWIDSLGAALGLFLVEKNVLPPDQIAPVAPDLKNLADRAAASEAATLAFLTFRARAARLGFDAAIEPPLARSPLVDEARRVAGPA